MSVIYRANEVKACYATKYNPDNTTGKTPTCIVNGSNAYQYRTYLQHDFSGIPCGSKIISAKLYVYVMDGNNSYTDAKHKFDIILSEWDETTLTWNTQPSSANLTIPSSWCGAPTLNAWNSWDITEFVQKWVYQVLPNNGLRFVNYDETSYQTNWKMYNRRQSEEYATYIEVEYEPIEQWCISHERMVELANSIRAKTGKTELLTVEGMVIEINSIETGSSSASMFGSNASGTLPTVYKGTASSEFILEFETSATGALQEG